MLLPDVAHLRPLIAGNTTMPNPLLLPEMGPEQIHEVPEPTLNGMLPSCRAFGGSEDPGVASAATTNGFKSDTSAGSMQDSPFAIGEQGDTSSECAGRTQGSAAYSPPVPTQELVPTPAAVSICSDPPAHGEPEVLLGMNVASMDVEGDIKTGQCLESLPPDYVPPGTGLIWDWVRQSTGEVNFRKGMEPSLQSERPSFRNRQSPNPAITPGELRSLREWMDFWTGHRPLLECMKQLAGQVCHPFLRAARSTFRLNGPVVCLGYRCSTRYWLCR